MDSLVEPFLIVVSYVNGTTSTFKGCVSVVETDHKLMFVGTKDGEDAPRTWTIILVNVTEFSKTPQ